MSYSAIKLVTKNEFTRIWRNPAILIIGIVLFIVTLVTAAGDATNLKYVVAGNNRDGLILGYGQVFYYTNFICGIMAAFLGMMAISEDRFKGTFNVLLSKPIYRRDFILGKFFGLAGFIALFLTMDMITNFILLLYYYGEPYSYSEAIVRISAYIFVLSLDLVLVMGLTMLIGIVCKNVLTAAALVVTYLSFEWFWNQGTSLIAQIIHIPLTPYIMTGRTLFPRGNIYLFNSTIPFVDWLTLALPNIVIMALIVTAILLVNCHVFARIDDV